MLDAAPISAEKRLHYANVPDGAGVRALVARVFPVERDNAPLLIWLHSGGFHAGTIDNVNHPLLAAEFAAHGIATAVLEYRLRCPEKALSEQSQELLPQLHADAAQHDFGLRPMLRGAASIGAMESVILFLHWIALRGPKHRLVGPLLLGGSSAGAITVLNTLSLAAHLRIRLPRFEAAFCLSGGFAFPSFYSPHPTPVFAMHNPSDPKVPIASIRAYSERAGERCTLIESRRQGHGRPGRYRKEPLEDSVARMVAFARDSGGRV